MEALAITMMTCSMGQSPSPLLSLVILLVSTCTSTAIPHPQASLAALTAFSSSGAVHPGINILVLTTCLPLPAEGRCLCILYLAQAPWFFGVITPAAQHARTALQQGCPVLVL
ncbi:hypothetical protein B0H10DRAFT_2237883 [Mycena sp. CBHHK59/15]|nr:hypothetical protein B0H10DRAFT_2237883 [Mycena sp. CBHHK59/15]